VQPKCTTPFPELPAHGNGSVLCIRVDEIARAGVTWVPDDIGAEIAPGAAVPPASPAGVSS
jgi:peptide/nickel transport system permease protein